MSTPEERVRALIEEEGPITFARFMEQALYGEGGYYSRQELPIGVDGDFVTGSSYSSLFPRATARLLTELDETLERPADFLEVGYGEGLHLRGLVEALQGGSDRRLLGCDRIRRTLPLPIETISGLEEVDDGSLAGVVFSYELFDALPIHRLVGRRETEVGELLVGLAPDGALVWREARLSDPALERLLGGGEESLVRGQIADLSPDWTPLYGKMAEKLSRGLLVTCDYGFPRRQLLDRRVRPHGTLACYRRQQVHRNPLIEVGKQDLTAHVDFTALMEEGERRGLETVALTRQAGWLTACGIFEDLADAAQIERLEAMTLLDPSGMGEEIRVLIQARGLEVEEILDLQYLL